MKYVAIAVLAVVICMAAVRYCFADRSLSTRLLSFYILVGALFCEALVLSYVLLAAGDQIFNALSDNPDTYETVFTAPESDPSGAAFIDSRGKTIEKPAGDASSAVWRAWQDTVRSRLGKSIYRTDFTTMNVLQNAQQTGEQNLGAGVVRRDFTVRNARGEDLLAVVLLPAERPAAPLAGIVVVAGHVGDDESGLAQLVLGVESYHQSAALVLAEAGFVTVAIELPGFGLRGPPRYADHRIVAFNALLAGDFYKKWAFEDINAAANLLASMPETDSGRIGILGVAFGGELAVEYAALDKRIAAVSFHAHGGGIGTYHGMTKTPAKYPHYCHIVPGAFELLTREDQFLLVAPRPMQGVRGGKQPFKDDRFVTVLSDVWRTLDAADQLDLRGDMPAPEIYRGNQLYTPEAIEFFRQHLAGDQQR
ncbi:MAG: dienelactone hydrolase family protein [Pseudomonadota bacterium]